MPSSLCAGVCLAFSFQLCKKAVQGTLEIYKTNRSFLQEQKQWVDALADCGRARALNPSFHRVLRRLSKIHEELGRPGQAAECLQELKTLGTHSSTDTSELHRSIMQLNAKKRMDGSPHHFRMLNVATSAAVCNYPSTSCLPGLFKAHI